MSIQVCVLSSSGRGAWLKKQQTQKANSTADYSTLLEIYHTQVYGIHMLYYIYEHRHSMWIADTYSIVIYALGHYACGQSVDWRSPN